MAILLKSKKNMCFKNKQKLGVTLLSLKKKCQKVKVWPSYILIKTIVDKKLLS